jgi:hypothetical protein
MSQQDQFVRNITLRLSIAPSIASLVCADGIGFVNNGLVYLYTASPYPV